MLQVYQVFNRVWQRGEAEWQKHLKSVKKVGTLQYSTVSMHLNHFSDAQRAGTGAFSANAAMPAH